MKNPWRVVLGQERLWVVFWLYCVLGPVVLVAFFTVSELSVDLVLIVYLLWAHYSLWTCAFNTRWRPCGYAARIYACVIAVAVTASLLVNVRDGPHEGSLEVLQVQ